MSSLVDQMGHLGELCSLRKLTPLPGKALDRSVETDAVGVGVGDGLLDGANILFLDLGVGFFFLFFLFFGGGGMYVILQ